MKKIIWQNLLNQAKTFGAAAQVHANLLETFLKREDLQARGPDDLVNFLEFLTFAEQQGVTKATLFNGPLLKVFHALENERPEQTRHFAEDNHTVIYHFKDAARTEIYNIEVDLDNYVFLKTLGAGSNGTTRLYQNSKRELLALKVPNPEIPQPHYYHSRKREIEIAKMLYPEDGFYCINKNFRYVYNSDGKIVPSYIFYSLMPYIHGENFAEFCSKITTKAELLETLIAVSEELQRIHSLDIIHGDIKHDNMILWHDPKTHKVCVRFIDFEWSYYRYAEKARMTPQKTSHWAPERIHSPETHPDFIDESFIIEAPDAHPTQDLFSYGHMLAMVLQLERTEQDSLLNVFPFLKKYCNEFLQPESENRPLLESFIFELHRQAELEKTLAQKTKAEASQSSTAYVLRLGLAAQQRPIIENFFAPEEPAKTTAGAETSQEKTNQSHNIFRHSTLIYNHFAPSAAPSKPEDTIEHSAKSHATSTIRYEMPGGRPQGGW
jgi:serine/threonine protein kinase